jgi:hypothetical protein
MLLRPASLNAYNSAEIDILVALGSRKIKCPVVLAA